jgi:hypothetical protein
MVGSYPNQLLDTPNQCSATRQLGTIGGFIIPENNIKKVFEVRKRERARKFRPKQDKN